MPKISEKRKTNIKLEDAIINSGLMRSSLAERAGLSGPARLSQILHGKTTPNEKEKIGLAAALNVPVSDLF